MSSEQPLLYRVQEGPDKLEARGKIVTGIPTYLETIERRPYVPLESGEEPSLKHPGVPRANICPSVEQPFGTTKDNYAGTHQHQTAMQQHVVFFDRDNDGILWPTDTYVGFRRIGFGYIVSLLAVLVIHFNFSYPTVPGWLPDPFFRIWLDKIHKAKHGSDSDTYDSEGRFIPQHFEDFFEKYSSVQPHEHDLGTKGEKGAVCGDGGHGQPLTAEARANYTKKGLTYQDVLRAWKGQRRILDPIGWSAELLEWSAVYLLLWPEDGIMRKEDIRRVFDGSLFWDLAEDIERKRMEAIGVSKGQTTQRMEKLQKEKDIEYRGGKKMMDQYGFPGMMGRDKLYQPS